MDPKDKQTIDALSADINRLKRLIHIMDRRIKQLERDNIRIKHDARGVKVAVATRYS